jgi:type IV pilus assembly protein PilN
MRLNINLASQPYELAQSYKRRMTTVIVALGLMALVLIGYIVYQRQRSRGINRQLTQVEAQIQSLGHEEAQARAILNKPANKVIADQSDFLNQLFARKSLSWTRIFTEMEKIVPAGLHVVSMKPEYTKTNDLVLHVIVATDSRDRAVEMVRHMESSNHLRQAQIVAETVTTNSSGEAVGGGNIQFDIAAIYVPGAAESDEATPAAGADKNGTQPPGAAPKRAAMPQQNASPGANPPSAATARAYTGSTSANNRPPREH